MDINHFKREAIGGLTTFLTMSYIVVVNPSILSTEGTGMAFSGVLTATVLVCALSTIIMGLYAKLPYALAPGMGINAFFTFTGLRCPRILLFDCRQAERCSSVDVWTVRNSGIIARC